VRDRSKAQDVGVQVREGDFDRPVTLVQAFAGADRLLLVSTDTFDNAAKLGQHRAAVAAVEARVGHVVYTSITAADTNGIVLADAHRPTEQAILASGLPYTFLRNDWYLENDLGTIAGALATGTLATSSRGGRFAPPRARTTPGPRPPCWPRTGTRGSPTSSAPRRRPATPTGRRPCPPRRAGTSRTPR